MSRVLLQDYREAFRRPSTVKTDQAFFFCGQMLDFLHRLLRRNISRQSLREENDWDAMLSFEFIDAQVLSILQLMEKTEFRTNAMRAAKRLIIVGKETYVTASASSRCRS